MQFILYLILFFPQECDEDIDICIAEADNLLLFSFYLNGPLLKQSIFRRKKWLLPQKMTLLLHLPFLLL